MKKFLSIVLTICLILNIFSLVSYSTPLKEGISLDEFANSLRLMQRKYDEEYVGEILIEDGSEEYQYNGEDMPLTDGSGNTAVAEVDEEGIDIPLSVLEDNSAEKESGVGLFSKRKSSSRTASQSSETNIDEKAQQLGYEITVSDDKAILSQPYQTHRLIVKSKNNINALDSVAIVEGYDDLHIVQFDDLESTVSALEYYENQPDVEFVEPDSVMQSCGYGFHQSWGSTYIECDEYIDTMGDLTNLPEIEVAVIDTGIELTHYMLESRIIRTNFNASGSGASNSENDDNGHGTHVAGIVVDNTTDNVKIRGYKCLDNTGYGPLSSVVLCINKAIQDEVDIINMSLSEEGKSTLMEEAVHNARTHGIVVVVAAGNEGVDAQNTNPAYIDECITVAALKQGNHDDFYMAGFSNFGDAVDIIAPGVAIGSAFLDGVTASLDGTSMATPFVAAASALILSTDTTLSQEQIMAVLEANQTTRWTKPASLCNCFDLHLGTNEALELRTATPKISLPGGEYNHTILVEITCSEPATIYYSTDGNEITYQNNTVYNGTTYTMPIRIRSNTTLYALAVASGKRPSLLRYANYTVTANYSAEDDYIIDDSGYISQYLGSDTNITVPDTVSGITVTGLGENLFADNTSLTEIRVPDTVTYIGDCAFSGCTNLTDFYGNGIINIGNGTFKNCSKLTGINCPCLNIVGNSAFEGCSLLTTVGSSNITTVGASAFKNCLAMIDFDFSSLISVGNAAFEGCEKITSITNSVMTAIPAGAFSYMPYLKSISFPNAVTVEAEAFMYDRLLNNINLPNVETLGHRVFVNCSALSSVNLPSLKLTGSTVFSQCSNLSSVNMPLVEEFGPDVFSGCTKLTDVSFPNLIKVGFGAFQLCSKLSNVDLPKAEIIGGGAFYNNLKLKSIYLPSATTFESNGQQFYGCAVLEEVNLPNLTGELPEYCFYNTAVKNINLPKITSLGQMCIDKRYLELLYVPNLKTTHSTPFTSGTNTKSVSIVIFAPKAESFTSIPYSNAPTVLFFSDALTDMPTSVHSNPARTTIIAPGDSAVFQWASNGGYSFTDSNTVLGLSGSASSEKTLSRLRFRFTWANDFSFKKYISDIDYGMEYLYNGEYRFVSADNHSYDLKTDTVSFNLVIDNVPTELKGKNFYARKVITIDGMTFRSAEISGVYPLEGELSSTEHWLDSNSDNRVNSDDIDLLMNISLGIVDPSDPNVTVSPLADMNGDGVIDAFDIAEYDRLEQKNDIRLHDDNIINYPAA